MRTTTETTRQTFAAYVRVSTDKQAASGLGMEAQRDALTRWAAFKGVDLAWYVDAAESAVKLPLADRPEGARLLADVAAGRVAGLAAVKLDRPFRDTIDALTVSRDLDRAGAALVLLDLGIDTTTPTGRFALTIFSGFAELEAARIAERTRDAMRAKKARGEFCGGRIPYGFRLAAEGVALEEDPAEQGVIAAARKARSRGLSLRAVAAELARQGFRPRTGAAFDAKAISRMVEAA